MSFLVADDELVNEDVLIGLPALKQSQMDTRTLLENSQAVLDGSDCSHVGNPTIVQGGNALSRLMMARCSHINTNEVVDKAHSVENLPVSIFTMHV